MARAEPIAPAGVRSRARPIRLGDLALRLWVACAAVVAAALIFLILGFLIAYSWPAIIFNGTHFFETLTWNMGNLYAGAPEQRNGYTASAGAEFGVLVFIFGTVTSSALAMLIATPLAILVALALVYQVPPALRPASSALLELMAGVPSVVYGLWGLIVLVPFIGHVLGPLCTTYLGFIPIFGGSPGTGSGLLASGIILAIMILPIMAATMRDVIGSVDRSIFEASLALGSTSWQAVIRAVLPSVRTGLVAAAMLALGRALGETMAVLMVSGSAINQLPQNVFAPINTMAAVIVAQLDSALTDATGMAERTLGEIALVLFAITLAVNVLARAIMRGSDRSGARARV